MTHIIPILIATAFATFTIGLFLGASIAAGARADHERTIITLKTHLQNIIHEHRTTGKIHPNTIQNASNTLQNIEYTEP